MQVYCERSTLTEESDALLDSLVDAITTLHTHDEFAQYSLIGSGVQRKIDRVSLGTQSMALAIGEEDRRLYIEEITQIVRRLDGKGDKLAIEVWFTIFLQP